MTDFEKLIAEYTEKFPNIPKKYHPIIIEGALGGQRPHMTEEQFRKWYDEAGQYWNKDLRRGINGLLAMNGGADGLFLLEAYRLTFDPKNTLISWLRDVYSQQ
jgi:hypothetical protein